MDNELFIFSQYACLTVQNILNSSKNKNLDFKIPLKHVQDTSESK